MAIREIAVSIYGLCSPPPIRAKLILTLTERGQGEVTREEAAEILGSTLYSVKSVLSLCRRRVA